MKVNFAANGSYTFDKSLTRSQAVTITGTWGSGTMTIAVIDGFSGDAVTRDTATANYTQEILVGRGQKLRVTLSGATSPDLNVYVEDLYE